MLIARENGHGDPPGWLKTLIIRSTNPAVSVVTYESGSYPTSIGSKTVFIKAIIRKATKDKTNQCWNGVKFPFLINAAKFPYIFLQGC